MSHDKECEVISLFAAAKKIEEEELSSESDDYFKALQARYKFNQERLRSERARNNSQTLSSYRIRTKNRGQE